MNRGVLLPERKTVQKQAEVFLGTPGASAPFMSHKHLSPELRAVFFQVTAHNWHQQKGSLDNLP